MWALIRTIAIFLLATRLTTLIIGTDIIYELTIVSLTSVTTLQLLNAYYYDPATLRRILIIVLLSCILTVTLVGIDHNISQADMNILVVTALLTWCLLDAWYGFLYGEPPIWNFLALLVPPILLSIWPNTFEIFAQPLVSIQQPQISVQQLNRITIAIGGDIQEQAKRELEARFGLPGSSTWQTAIGDTMPVSGPWPLDVFFPDFADNGHKLAATLWGQHIDRLQIADTPKTLQPLLGCRNAIRSLFKGNPRFTPFFQLGDFGGNTAHVALTQNIYRWSKGHPDVIQAQAGCTTQPRKTETVPTWIGRCIAPIDNQLTGDQKLQRIKLVGKTCSTVKFN